ncbi:MAG: hypothetical protein ACOZCL_00030 [Bacillota bacterium]
MKLVRYIHQNPVREGIIKKAELYKWSSDIYYGKNISSFIRIDMILKMLDEDKQAAIVKHKEFMEEVEYADYSRLNAIGDEAYRNDCCVSKKHAG